MSKKKRALKALVWLGVIVAACMYFSRTIQTITTPKVKLVQATTGRIEQKISVDAKPYFPGGNGNHPQQGQGLSHHGG